MDNILENIIGGILTATPLILIIVKIFATEYISNLTKEFFNSKSKKKADIAFNSIVVLFLIIGISIILSPYYFKENVQEKHIKTTSQKSDAEIAFEAGQVIYNEVKEGIKKKKEKNTKIIKNRKKRLVYKIGDIKDNEESILNMYEKLKDIPSFDYSRIFVFKISRNKYFVYKNAECSEKQIKDSLTNFKKQLNGIVSVVEIIDLMKYCKVKESITETRPLKFRKKRIKIPCYYCDN